MGNFVECDFLRKEEYRVCVIFTDTRYTINCAQSGSRTRTP